MGSAVLFILRSRLLLYSAGSGVNRVQFVLSGFSVRLFCFVQANTLSRYVFLGCTRACVCRCDGILVCSSFLLVCICLVCRKLCSYRVLQ